MFVIYAPNVRAGGGLSLLKELLIASENYHAILDERAKSHLPKIGNVSWVPSGLAGRIKAEWWLRRRAQDAQRVLCFHNLPPLTGLPTPFDIYLQNRFVIDGSLEGMDVKTRLRILGERALFRVRARLAERIIVQTPTMAKLVRENITSARVVVAPFIARTQPHEPQTRIFDFCYPATPGPHKNHRVVAEALKLVGADGVQIRFAVTAPAGTAEHRIYRAAASSTISIETLEYLSPTEVAKLYSQSKALLFASTLESFGLPLIEAENAGLDIIAPELDYVRDVCTPTETFDPASATSLARAIKRYLHVPEKPVVALEASGIVRVLLSGNA